jgi:three-Cys-motif partner protein
MVEHRYGGPWSEIKLEILRKYLGFFTSALRNKDFVLRYIDGFAGTGSRTMAGEGSVETIFGYDEALEWQEVDGSAKIALATKPPFQRLDFVEDDPRRFSALQNLCVGRPEATAHAGDANAVLTELCRNTVWRGAGASGNGIRAVLFLDPYGLTVDYTTLQTVSRTKAIDVWYLFPLAGLYRQAARHETAISPDKAAAITRILGTDEWRKRFYERTPDLLDLDGRSYRTADVDAIEDYVRERLKNVFVEVTRPKRIYHSRGMPIFSLFFAVSNPDKGAVGLAMKAANQILSAGISSQSRSR